MTTNTSNKKTSYFKPLAGISLAVLMAGFASASVADTSGAIKLNNVQGKVMVDTGAGQVAGNNGMLLKPDYKIILSDNAQAKIVYPDNCTQALKENTLVKVGSISDCKLGFLDEKSFTKTAALGDVAVQQTTPAINSTILVWSAALGVTVGTSNSNNSNSNQSPDASAR